MHLITASINDIDLKGWKAHFYGSGGQNLIQDTEVVKLQHSKDEDGFILTCKNGGGTYSHFLPQQVWEGLKMEGKTLTLQRTSQNGIMHNQPTLSIDVHRVVLFDPLDP